MDALNRVLSSRLENVVPPLEAEVKSELFQRQVEKVCEDTLPRGPRRARRAPWWNRNLTRLETQTKAARRFMQNNRDVRQRDPLRVHFCSKRRQYKNATRKEKQKHGGIVLKNCENDPYGMMYKLSCGEIKQQPILIKNYNNLL